MTIYKFSYFVYGDHERPIIAEHIAGQGVPQDIADGLADYFRDWEVELGCTYDTETEELTIENHA